MAAHNELGRWGEDCAAQYLESKGFIIMERDWHSHHRDIDIIARKNEELVFIEVKTRQNRTFSDPEQAVDYRKLRNLQAAINHYLKMRGPGLSPRFDIVSVVGTIGNTPEIEHIEDVRLL